MLYYGISIVNSLVTTCNFRSPFNIITFSRSKKDHNFLIQNNKLFIFPLDIK